MSDHQVEIEIVGVRTLRLVDGKLTSEIIRPRYQLNDEIHADDLSDEIEVSFSRYIGANDAVVGLKRMIALIERTGLPDPAKIFRGYHRALKQAKEGLSFLQANRGIVGKDVAQAWLRPEKRIGRQTD